MEAGGPASNVLSERSLSLYARRGRRYSPNYPGSENGSGGNQGRPGRDNIVDDDAPGTGRLPGERGRQLRLLRYATGTGLRGQTVRRVTRDISRPTALLLEHLQSVGNFGQHQDDTVERPFAVSVCLTAIALCHGLSVDLKQRG